jgi:cobalt-precorrin 5A hydrolase / precorrin-3B C17-methyltransferase
MTQVAIVILGQQSLPLARRIKTALPEAVLYGTAKRTTDVDIPFANFGDTLRALFTDGTPIVGICAAGILIRTLAPLLSNKWNEPPVLAVAEDGSAVVPLLGGLHGVNGLARRIADVLHVAPAVTTTGDLRFRTALLSPPVGYHLANPEHAKTFIADLLAGASVRLEGTARWLQESNLPIATDGPLAIKVTERLETPVRDCLVYHPATIAIGMCRHTGLQATGGTSPHGNGQDALRHVHHLLGQVDIALASVSAIFGLDAEATDPVIQAVAQSLHVPTRFFTPDEIALGLQRHASAAVAALPTGTASAIALAAVGDEGHLIPMPASPHAIPYDFAIGVALRPLDPHAVGRGRGWLAIVGTGPGGTQWMSPEVRDVLQMATDWVGYTTYLDLAEPLRHGQHRHEFDNREELERACMALDLAAEGRAVALVSSGDPGIYAMAAAVFEVLEREDRPAWHHIEIQVCPGISAMQAAAAQVGAPLGHDFCVISLSDILKPWTVIEQRIAAAVQADFVLVFYNPVSRQRTWQLQKAKEIVLQWRSPDTPVVIARNLGRPGQEVTIKPLEQLTAADADMRTILLVGSQQTRTIQRSDGKSWVYTPRRYAESRSAPGTSA